MPGTLLSNRRSNCSDRGNDLRGRERPETEAGHRYCRYYATDRRRHRYSSFSIMKWFRRSKQQEYDEDSAWFRDDLKRIRQAYMEQESDYAAVTPIAPHRRPAATWSRWSGSTTTVYSFAYVGGAQRDEDGPVRTSVPNRRPGRDTDDDDAVEYIDAATLQVPRRRTNRGGQPQQSSSCATSSKKPTAATLNRVSVSGTLRSSATMTSTITSTRRRNKRLAPPPPAVPVAGPSSANAGKASTQRRAAVTTSKKKYRAPQPPAVIAAESRPQSQRPALSVRRGKGPAPKPPVLVEQQRPQRPKSFGERQTGVVAESVRPSGSNVKQKITQYERDRLMERVDKIEKHFFRKEAKTTAAIEKRVENTAEPTAAANEIPRNGFASVAALYAAMTATNLTELDKRAAEICRKTRLETAAEPSVTARADVSATNAPWRSAVIPDDHKNAIVTAVIRKSFPATVVDVAAVDGKRSSTASKTTTPGGSGIDDTPSTDRRKTVTAPATASTPDAEKLLVRHKRLAFFTPQQAAVVATSSPTAVAAATPANASTAKLSFGTQTTGTVVVAKTNPESLTNTAVGKKTAGECSTEPKNLSSEDNNCYQQLMAMEMQSDLVLHNGPFECAVCLCTYDNNGVVLRDCLHVFCRPCLQMTIGHSQAEQIRCPYMDKRYSCTGVLQHREIKKILNSEEEYEQFLQRSVERARQLLAKERNGGSFQCGRPDCTGWCVIYNKNKVLNFECPVCGMVTCVRCGSIHAPGEGCQTVENYNGGGSGDTQDTLKNLIDRGDAMPCPGCNTILSKQQGCDWIKCAVCFMEICWATKGPRWGPMGKGDTSAGCMCGIPPGRKCHSDCKYCH